MSPARVEDPEDCRYGNEELLSSAILAKVCGVARPDSLSVEPSSEFSVISSMFSGFHALGPLFRPVECAFARALSETGAAFGGSFLFSASRPTCLALAAVAAAYSAARA
jgi:hypothetical protein